MASLRSLLKDSVVYGLSSIVGRFLNYLLVPLYTYKIAASTGGYGVVTNVYAYTALLLVLLTFGMETTYFYFANREGVGERAAYRTALGVVGTLSGVFVVLVWAFLPHVAGWMGYADHPEYLAIMALVVALDAVQSIMFARLRWQGRAWRFAALKLAFIVGNIGLNLFVFLVAPHWADRAWMGWYNADEQVGYIFKINLVCTALVTLGFLPRKGDAGATATPPVRTLLRPMLRYAWPLLLLGIVGILNQVADKILFPYLLPGEEGRVQLGMYGACVKVAMVMAMITQAFRYAYEPFVFGGGRDKNSKQTQAEVMKYFVQFTLLAFLAVVAYLDVLRYLISPDYWGALRAVPIVMMAEILMGIYFNLSFWYKLIGQTGWGAAMSAVGTVVMVVVNVLFVPRVGYMACAWGGLAGYGVCVLISYLLCMRKNPIPYAVGEMGLFFALALAEFALMWWLPLHGWVKLAVNTVLLLAFAAVVAWREQHLVRPIVNKLIHRR